MKTIALVTTILSTIVTIFVADSAYAQNHSHVLQLKAIDGSEVEVALEEVKNALSLRHERFTGEKNQGENGE